MLSHIKTSWLSKSGLCSIIHSGHIRITNTDGKTTLPDDRINKFFHFGVRLLGEKPRLTVILKTFYTPQMIEIPSLGQPFPYNSYFGPPQFSLFPNSTHNTIIKLYINLRNRTETPVFV